MSNSSGNILECNNAPGQPTVALGGPVNTAVPVGCTAPTYNLVTTSATGTISTSYNVVEGTVGPPCGTSTDVITVCPGADSAGLDPATDAANYPCPPTPDQHAAGVTCSLLFGDAAGDNVRTPILFGTTSPPSPTAVPTTTPPESGAGPTTTQPASPVTASTDAPAPSTTSAAGPEVLSGSASSVPSTTRAPATRASSSKNDPPGSGSTSAATPVVQASSRSLAFTGPGAAIQWFVVAGSALILLGLGMLMVGDAPRRLRWALARRTGGVQTYVDCEAWEVAPIGISRERLSPRADRPIAHGADSRYAEGWYVDPFAVHEERLFKEGFATPAVRDDGVGSYDEPPER